MKKAVLVLLFASPLACALGEISGGGGGGGGAPATVGGAGTGVVTGSAGSTGMGGTVTGLGSGTAGTGSGTGSSGTGGTSSVGVAGSTGAAGTVASGCAAGTIPADVAMVISTRCVACHGNPPLQGVPTSLTTYAQLAAPSMSDPTKSVAALALVRLKDTVKPMPPPPLTPATANEIAAFQGWVGAGLGGASCADGGAPGGGVDAGGTIPNPYDTPVMCSSKTTWTRGNSESPDMNPGMTCIDCHTKMNKGPKLTIGGTVFPTAHEPDLCNGGNTTTGARVVIVGADGKSITLTPTMSGNFRYEGVIAKPYSAKVTYMGRERGMIQKQTSGDCNSCHTQMGTMMAPGRIMLP